MALWALSDTDQQVIFQCLKAILEGPFIDGLEFQTRLGINRDELSQVVQAWPNVDDSNQDSVEALAINNCMNELCHGLNISDCQWSQWLGVDRRDVCEVYSRWASLNNYSRGLR